MEQVLQMIADYGLETVLIALLINVLTGLIKLPIKAWTSKLKESTSVTRFIVFLPIALGFLLTFCYEKFIQNTFSFDKAFITLWLTASSLSLTFYAIFEKIFPSKKKLVNEAELKTSERILENISQIFEAAISGKEEKLQGNAFEAASEEEKTEPKQTKNKIILRGRTNEEVEIKK